MPTESREITLSSMETRERLAAWTFLDTNGHLIPLDQSWVDLMVRVASDPRFDETELVEAFVARMRFDEPIE
jgi:hypothetical protein